jgi:hypothetical protein
VVKEFPAEEVRILRPIEAKLCGKGSKVEAVYPKHGKYYPARIVEKGLTKDSYVVLFEGYGDKTVLDACLLRPRVASAEKKGEEEPAYVTPGGYRIPESLKIKDKDSEWVKENKKRKIHEIKSEQRIEKQTHDAEERKQNWKQFQAKISRKK